MKRFAKSASAIALAGAVALGATPAASAQGVIVTDVTGTPTEVVNCPEVEAAAYSISGATSDAITAYNALPIEQRLDKAAAQAVAAKTPGAVVDEEKVIVAECKSGVGAGALLPLALLGGAALLSSNGSSEPAPAEKPAPKPAPAPEKPAAPAAPQKGIDPKAAPEKGVKPAEAAPAKRGVLAQTGSAAVAPVAIMLALTVAAAGAFIARRKSA